MKSACMLGAAVLAFAGPTPCIANPLKSAYSTIEPASCKVLSRHQDRTSWSCPGLPGYPIWLEMTGRRTFVSVGDNGSSRRAGRQTLPWPNTPFAGTTERATLEWRIKQRGGRTVPHATILRYYTSKGGAKGQMLVVMRVTPDEACHVAHVDASGNPSAIATARSIADEKAPSFDCKSQPSSIAAPEWNPR